MTFVTDRAAFTADERGFHPLKSTGFGRTCDCPLRLEAVRVSMCSACLTTSRGVLFDHPPPIVVDVLSLSLVQSFETFS